MRHHQRLVWKRLKFDRDADGNLDHDSARYACVKCGVLIEHSKKAAMVAAGRWEATSTTSQRYTVGYHISALYSPWRTWAQIAEAHLAAGRDRRKRKTWANTELGETSRAEGDAPDWIKLWRRREPYGLDELPEGVVLLTAGVDAQRDRIELEIVGWGERLESWSIDYQVIGGDTAKDETWEQLDALLAQTWPHANGGALAISRMAIDVGDGSYSAPTIHRWAKFKLPRVMPVRGRGDASQPVYQRREATLRKSKGRRARLGTFWPVGVGLLKSELYAALQLEEPAAGEAAPNGWCHFP
ncbi:MAG: terminase gpA endonuclease subunit, partial [Planctomycetota bacterium]